MIVIGPKEKWFQRKVSAEISLKVNNNKLRCSSQSKMGSENRPSSDRLGQKMDRKK